MFERTLTLCMALLWDNTVYILYFLKYSSIKHMWYTWVVGICIKRGLWILWLKLYWSEAYNLVLRVLFFSSRGRGSSCTSPSSSFSLKKPSKSQDRGMTWWEKPSSSSQDTLTTLITEESIARVLKGKCCLITPFSSVQPGNKITGGIPSTGSPPTARSSIPTR